MATESLPLFKIPDELRTLIERSCNEVLSKEESVRLSQLLREDAKARSFYLSYLAMHSRLQWEFDPKLSAKSPEEFLAAGPAMAAHPVSRRRPFRRSMAVASIVAVVAGLVLGISFTGWRPWVAEVPRPSDSPVSNPQVAMVNGCHEVQWAAGTDSADDPVEPGTLLPPGRLHLLSGVVELAFADGAIVLLEGPSEFEIMTPSRGFLHHGQAVVRVPQQARGFVLAARNIDIVDLGTEFGVRVTPSGRTEIQVFEGNVVAQVNDDAGGTIEKRPIEAGEAIAVDTKADVVVQAIAYTPPKYVRQLPAPELLASAATPAPKAHSANAPHDVPARAAEHDSAAVPASLPADLPYGVPEGAVLLLTFDPNTTAEQDGQYTFKDQSGNGNDARTVGAKWTAGGISGGVCEFDGENGYIECRHAKSFNIPGPMTISMWVKLSKWDQGGGLCTKGTGEGGESWLIDVYNDKFRFVRRPIAANPFYFVSAKETVIPDKWYHIVAIVDSERLRLFTNLEETVGEAYAKESQVNDHVVTIGSRQAGDGPYDENVGGVIDEVGIWPRALTADEVQMLHERGKRNKKIE